MLTADLAGFVLVSLSFGKVSAAGCALLSAAGIFLFLCMGNHEHGGVLVIDVYARQSRFFSWNASLKTGGCMILLLLCVLSPSVWPPLFLAAILAALTAFAGGLGFHRYLSLLRMPAAFLLLSGIALLWDYSIVPAGVLTVPFFHGCLTVTAETQAVSRLVMARALGAVSCLYFLSLSTPLPEILAVMRRAQIPSVISELAILIYRYIFVLLSVYRDMKNTASSRLGYGGFRKSLRTTGAVYGNLLAKSFHRAGACFDAMESRCYQGEIRFLEQEKPVFLCQRLLFGTLIAAAASAVAYAYAGKAVL